MLRRLVDANGPTHLWWPETVSLRDTEIFDLGALSGYKQITDTWLIAVAATNNGKLATCDLRLGSGGVRKASAANITPVTQQ